VLKTLHLQKHFRRGSQWFCWYWDIPYHKLQAYRKHRAHAQNEYYCSEVDDSLNTLMLPSFFSELSISYMESCGRIYRGWLGDRGGADVGTESAGYWVGKGRIGWKCCYCMGDCQGFATYRPRYVIQMNPPKSLPQPLNHPPHPTSTHHIPSTHAREHTHTYIRKTLSPTRGTTIQ
jgi:hypothetical protein